MTHLDLDSELLEFISSGDFKPGDRLPTIAELKSDEFLGLSVSKIREQLEVARTLGLVDVRSKTGMRLREYSFTPAVRLSLFYALAQDLSTFEFFGELRKHLEIAFWNEACALLTRDDLDAIERCIQQALHKLNHEWIQIPYQEHRQFHLLIFRRLENPFVQGLLEAYWDAYEAVEINRYADYDYLHQVWDYHRRILNEISQGDFDAAKLAFIEHTQLLRVRPQARNNGDAHQPD
jgi:DNA-binding FadR family transcriptional regulator